MKYTVDFGPQYHDDDDFKARARLHQSRFRVESLKLREFEEYGNRLARADALAGRNFYLAWEGLFAGVQARYALDYKKLYWDMLASDNVPFNFFLPLHDEPALASALLSHWLGESVTTTRTHVEWAPAPKKDYLDDSTSFDVFVTYETRGRVIGAVGVETKYSEREYDWGATERMRMFDDRSPYNEVHRRSGIYVEGAVSALRTKRLKQVWRNQLLGEAMLQQPAHTFSRFTSVLLYPSGNSHFAGVISEYERLLRPEVRGTRFVGVTFESFIAFLRAQEAQAPSLKVRRWLDYLEQRYIVVG